MACRSLMIAVALCALPAPTVAREVTMTVHGDEPGPIIDRHIFGQFAEHLGTGIYGGIWVGPDSKIPNVRGIRKDVVAALRAIQVPVVRWPGGCFADEYHWREGIGPRSRRPVKVNTNWGGVTESNGFGTHEFMDFVEQIGAEPYVSGNVGNGTPAEMAEWVEYMTAPAGSLAEERARNGHKEPWKLPYFGLGNELWGCGGSMRVDYAADVTRRYSTFIKVPRGTRTMKMASGASDNLGPDSEYLWTDGMMRIASDKFDGFGIHYYTFYEPRTAKSSATDFSELEWARILANAERMEGYITKHAAIMDKYDPAKRVAMAVDEWGTWYTPTAGTNPGFLQQQNTLRDAMVAAVTLNIFTKHGDRLRMANIAQMINVLQSMILTDGPKMVLTPTYHVFEMYKPFQDATFVPIDLKTDWYAVNEWKVPAVSATAARGKDGDLYIAIANVDPKESATIQTTIAGMNAASVTGRILTAPAIQSHNDFAHPDVVKPAGFNQARLTGNILTAMLPPHSIVVLRLH